jgi:hypothetical protein
MLMLNRVVRVEPLPNYRLRVEFDDGVEGTIDLSGELVGEVFEPLRDEAMFRRVTVDEYGAVCWPNGADLAPDAMHIELTGKTLARSGPRRKRASAARTKRGRAAE